MFVSFAKRVAASHVNPLRKLPGRCTAARVPRLIQDPEDPVVVIYICSGFLCVLGLAIHKYILGLTRCSSLFEVFSVVVLARNELGSVCLVLI